MYCALNLMQAAHTSIQRFRSVLEITISPSLKERTFDSSGLHQRCPYFLHPSDRHSSAVHDAEFVASMLEVEPVFPMTCCLSTSRQRPWDTSVLFPKVTASPMPAVHCQRLACHWWKVRIRIVHASEDVAGENILKSTLQDTTKVAGWRKSSRMILRITTTVSG